MATASLATRIFRCASLVRYPVAVARPPRCAADAPDADEVASPADVVDGRAAARVLGDEDDGDDGVGELSHRSWIGQCTVPPGWRPCDPLSSGRRRRPRGFV